MSSDTLDGWKKKCGEYQVIHYNCYLLYLISDFLLSFIKISLMLIASILSFVSLQDCSSLGLILGFTSSLATTIGTLQSYFKFSVTAQKHKTTYIEFTSIIEEMNGNVNNQDKIKERIDKNIENSPIVPLFCCFNQTINEETVVKVNFMKELEKFKSERKDSLKIAQEKKFKYEIDRLNSISVV